jgi:transcriptional regulator with XRE-family HTH domain
MQEREPIALRFGKRVRALRKQRELSQEDFALLCDLDRTYISGIERGRRNVSLRNIEVIATVLEVSLSDLFKDIERNVDDCHDS